MTSFLWGLGIVSQRAGMFYMYPLAFNGIRFGLGALLVFFVLLASGKGLKFSPDELRGGILAGLLLSLAVNLQQYGIVQTTASKTGFITGLYVVLVPLFGPLFGHRPGWGSFAGAFMAAGGLFLLTVKENFSILPGDLWVLSCAFVFAFHVLVLSIYSPRSDSGRLSFLQFVICSILSLLFSFFLEKTPLQGINQALFPLLYAGLISVGVGYTLQVVGQRSAPATHAAIIMSLESVFAALMGWLILGEMLDTRAILGCALIFAGIIVAQLKP